MLRDEEIIMFKVFIALAMLFTVLSIISYAFFYVKDNKAFDHELNVAVKSLVNKMMAVKFRTHDIDALAEILTEEMQEKLDDYFSDFFRETRLYYVNNRYMQLMLYEEEFNRWIIPLRVSEGFFLSKDWDAYYIEVGISEQENGSYLISFIAKSP